MLGYIEKMRKEPEHLRRKAAFRIALVITAVIAAVWIAFTAMRLSGTDFSFKQSGESASSSFSTVFSAWSDKLRAGFNGAQGGANP